ncbi:cell envelope biogenesis protein OmpA [Flaviramulus sp. BrNp1-15]|uniref:cell envelope biogenesis protein OmpA n=1 Tax=Flaviramulus sp. BrNp1-15 TaxID=2916754 RepID=UPI001EE897FD|nr:cell envelope biogenesis protein OmpA [Flaviramulus sp. BrNp1-15]ULC59847.1 cell envelope biogenesis protein OmpA [Flaviramulus sp. BrNp1-15]
MNQEDKLNILKDILLTDEREYTLSIQKKIKILEDTINKQKQLSTKVNPIINEKLDEFVKEIPSTLGPTITEALKTEIKNSQDAVVEALFPIIGKMIKKYVQQEMRILSEKINEQTNKFTFESLKRRFFSKKTGVSQGDLLIQDQIKPKVEQLMVIEKGSGLVVSEYSKTQGIDQDMVAGMLTAIKSFAEDAFSKENQDLQYIEYETYHIHLQNFSSYYIAVVISGAYNVIFKSKLEDKLLDFAKNYINKEDLQDQDSFSKKLKSYFKNEDF